MTVDVTNDHTEWHDFDTANSPIFDGNVWGSGDGISTLFFIEGTGSLNAQNKATGRGGMGDSQGSTDVSAAGLHIHGWINSLDIPNTEANGGWALRLSNSSSWDTDYESWNCGGSDTSRLRINGFIPLVADVNAAADRSAGTLTLSTASDMWVESDVTTNSGQKTVFCDRMFFGTHSRFRGGTTAGAAGDSITAAGETPSIPVFINAGGIYNVLDGLEIGDDTSATTQYWEDGNETWVFAGFPKIAYDFYRVEFRGHATGTHSVLFGTKSGTGIDATGAGGNTFVAGGLQPFHFIITDTNLDTAGMYGCIFNNAGDENGTFEATLDGAEFIGNQFSAMGQMTLDTGSTGVQFTRNGVVNSVTAAAGLEEAAVNLGTTKPATNQFRFVTIDGASRYGLRVEGTGQNDSWTFNDITIANSGTADILVDYPAQTGGNVLTINLVNSAFNSSTQVAVTGGIALADVVIATSVDFTLTNVVSGSTFTLDGAFTTAVPAGVYNGTGDSVIQFTGTIPSSFATSGDVRLFNGTYYEVYSYTGVSGTQLTGVTPTLSQDFNGANALLEMVAPVVITTDPYTVSVEPSQDFEAMLANQATTRYIPIQFSDNTGASGFSRRIQQIVE